MLRPRPPNCPITHLLPPPSSRHWRFWSLGVHGKLVVCLFHFLPIVGLFYLATSPIWQKQMRRWPSPLFSCHGDWLEPEPSLQLGDTITPAATSRHLSPAFHCDVEWFFPPVPRLLLVAGYRCSSAPPAARPHSAAMTSPPGYSQIQIDTQTSAISRHYQHFGWQMVTISVTYLLLLYSYFTYTSVSGALVTISILQNWSILFIKDT